MAPVTQCATCLLSQRRGGGVTLTGKHWAQQNVGATPTGTLYRAAGSRRGKQSGPDAPWEGTCPEAVSVAGELRGYRDLIFLLGCGRGLLYAVLVGGERGPRIRAWGQAQKGQEAGLLSWPNFSLPLGQDEGRDVCLRVCPRGQRMRREEQLVRVGTSLGGVLPLLLLCLALRVAHTPCRQSSPPASSLSLRCWSSAPLQGD